MEEYILKFVDAVNELDVEKLTDLQLQALEATCYNLVIDCEKELYKRGLSIT